MKWFVFVINQFKNNKKLTFHVKKYFSISIQDFPILVFQTNTLKQHSYAITWLSPKLKKISRSVTYVFILI